MKPVQVTMIYIKGESFVNETNSYFEIHGHGSNGGKP